MFDNGRRNDGALAQGIFPGLMIVRIRHPYTILGTSLNGTYNFVLRFVNAFLSTVGQFLYREGRVKIFDLCNAQRSNFKYKSMKRNHKAPGSLKGAKSPFRQRKF